MIRNVAFALLLVASSGVCSSNLVFADTITGKVIGIADGDTITVLPSEELSPPFSQFLDAQASVEDEDREKGAAEFAVATEGESMEPSQRGFVPRRSIRRRLGISPVKVRLEGIDCPERRQAFYQRAKQASSDLVFGKVVTVTTSGSDRYRRTIGLVQVEDTVLNHALVEKGLCWWYRKYAQKDKLLEDLEQQARLARRGVWSQPNPIPPWEFRRKK